MRRRAYRSNTWWISFASIAVLSMVPFFIWGSFWFDDRPLPNIRIAGTPVPRTRSLDPFLTRQATLWGEESLALRIGHHVFRPTRRQLGGALSIADGSAAIRELGRSPNPLIALRAWWVAHYAGGHALPWAPRVDNAALEDYIRILQQQIDRAPTPGALDVDGRVIEGLKGEVLDVETTKRSIRQALARHLHAASVPTIITPPPPFVRPYDHPSREADLLMVAHETEYRSESGRAVNIELAARMLNDVTVRPGARLSFNAIVGKRTQARGFAPATELVHGEVVQGIGGGVCQVAGTLHAAAFFAGLLVDEYHPHSRLGQFAYLRPGLDTMVAWPNRVTQLRDTKDLVIRNPYPFPIRVRATTSLVRKNTATLRVELYGAAKPFRVEWSFEEVARTPAADLERRDAKLGPGDYKLQQDGLPGMTIIRHRTIYMTDRVKREHVRITYPPTPRTALPSSR